MKPYLKESISFINIIYYSLLQVLLHMKNKILLAFLYITFYVYYVVYYFLRSTL